MEKQKRYTVIVKDGNIVDSDGRSVAPNYGLSCGHNHRTRDAAEECQRKLMCWSRDGRSCAAAWYNSIIHEHPTGSMDYVPDEYELVIRGEEEMEGRSGKITCPKCDSENISSCPGGTCKKGEPGIKYICQDCLNEFGDKEGKNAV